MAYYDETPKNKAETKFIGSRKAEGRLKKKESLGFHVVLSFWFFSSPRPRHKDFCFCFPRRLQDSKTRRLALVTLVSIAPEPRPECSRRSAEDICIKQTRTDPFSASARRPGIFLVPTHLFWLLGWSIIYCNYCCCLHFGLAAKRIGNRWIQELGTTFALNDCSETESEIPNVCSRGCGECAIVSTWNWCCFCHSRVDSHS